MSDQQSQIERRRRVLQGTVVSDKMDKTIVVRVERRIKHPIYGKYLNRSKRYLAHDEENRCAAGDFVAIVECQPLSKNKSWRLREVLRQASAVEREEVSA